MIRITEDGTVQIVKDLQGAGSDVRADVGRVLTAYAQKIRSDAINSMRRSTPRGRTYRIKGKRSKTVVHKASAPGQPPAVMTGRLWNSITVDSRNGGLSQEIGPTVNYGRYLEEGTSNMEARPFMEPALDRNVAGLESAMARTIAKRLGGT